MLFAADLTTPASRRDDISRKFFRNITKSCQHHLVPDPKMESHNSRLRSYEKFPKVYTRTKRYCSFIQYALMHLATIRIEYKITSLDHHTQGSLFSFSCMLVVSCTVVID